MPSDSRDWEKWIAYAKADLTMSSRALGMEPFFPEIACYHAQQCAEKCLKAYLVSSNIDFSQTHSLVYLVRLCMDRDSSFSNFMDTAGRLQNYAAQSRYPHDELDPPGMTEARQAIHNAKNIYEFIFDKITDSES